MTLELDLVYVSPTTEEVILKCLIIKTYEIGSNPEVDRNDADYALFGI